MPNPLVITPTSVKLATLRDVAELTLEPLLLRLCAFGKPAVRQMSKGWYCHIDMHVPAAGTSFSVASDFDCPTPLAAAVECALRVIAVLEQHT